MPSMATIFKELKFMTKEDLQKLSYELMLLVIQSNLYANQDIKDVVDKLQAEADFQNHIIKINSPTIIFGSGGNRIRP